MASILKFCNKKTITTCSEVCLIYVSIISIQIMQLQSVTFAFFPYFQFNGRGKKKSNNFFILTMKIRTLSCPMLP